MRTGGHRFLQSARPAQNLRYRHARGRQQPRDRATPGRTRQPAEDRPLRPARRRSDASRCRETAPAVTQRTRPRPGFRLRGRSFPSVQPREEIGHGIRPPVCVPAAGSRFRLLGNHGPVVRIPDCPRTVRRAPGRVDEPAGERPAERTADRDAGTPRRVWTSSSGSRSGTSRESRRSPRLRSSRSDNSASAIAPSSRVDRARTTAGGTGRGDRPSRRWLHQPNGRGGCLRDERRASVPVLPRPSPPASSSRSASCPEDRAADLFGPSSEGRRQVPRVRDWYVCARCRAASELSATTNVRFCSEKST